MSNLGTPVPAPSADFFVRTEYSEITHPDLFDVHPDWQNPRGEWKKVSTCSHSGLQTFVGYGGEVVIHVSTIGRHDGKTDVLMVRQEVDGRHSIDQFMVPWDKALESLNEKVRKWVIDPLA